MPHDVNTRPAFLSTTPAPLLEVKVFHRRSVPVWLGQVELDKIRGWLGNPRTEVQAEQWEKGHGRTPTNDEMLAILLAANNGREGTYIRELAGSILNNGVRMPVVLSHDGVLLDGNRRYFACLYLSTEGAPPEDRHRFRTLPAIVLPPDITEEVKSDILTEFNFLPDHRLPWPYYVRAMRVYDDYVNRDLSKETLVAKYGLKWSVLRPWIQAAKLCQSFLEYHKDPATGEPTYLAQTFAFEYFIMFDEMARRHSSKLEQLDYRNSVFDLLLDGYPGVNQRFRESRDVIRLPEIWDNPDGAWQVLQSMTGPRALEQALFIVSQTSAEDTPDPNPLMRDASRKLKKVIDADAWSRVSSDLLEEFHQLAQQVPGAFTDPGEEVERMVTLLDALTSLQMAQIDGHTLERLRVALDRVVRMAGAVSDSTLGEAS